MRTKKRASALLLSFFFLVIMLNVGVALSLGTGEVYYEKQLLTRILDSAAVAGTTQVNQVQLLQNIPQLCKNNTATGCTYARPGGAEQTAREYAALNLAGDAEKYMVPTRTQLACAPGPIVPPAAPCMDVWVRNIGELNPWTGAAVTLPTVFIEATVQVKGLASYGASDTGPGSLAGGNPLAGASIHVRGQAVLRTRT